MRFTILKNTYNNVITSYLPNIFSKGNNQVYEVIFSPMDGFLNDPVPLPPDHELKVTEYCLCLYVFSKIYI